MSVRTAYYCTVNRSSMDNLRFFGIRMGSNLVSEKFLDSWLKIRPLSDKNGSTSVYACIDVPLDI